MTVAASEKASESSRRVRGTERNISPPKYIIAICTAVIRSIIRLKARFFPIPEKIQRRSLRAEKQLKIPEKMKRA
jgi:hypothetical protein